MLKQSKTESNSSAIEIDIDSFDHANAVFLEALNCSIREFLTQHNYIEAAQFYVEQIETDDFWSALIYSSLSETLVDKLINALNMSAKIKCKEVTRRSSVSAQLFASWNQGQFTSHLQPSLATALIEGKEVELTKAFLSKLRQTQKTNAFLNFPLKQPTPWRIPSQATIGQLIASIELTYSLPEGSVKLFAPRNYEMDEDQRVGLLREAWGEL